MPAGAQETKDSKAVEIIPSTEKGVSDDKYQLQLNSFRVQSNAKRFFDWLVKKGYKPFMIFVDEGEPWFKVRMGPYPSKETATQLATELKEKHGLSSLVLLADKSGSASPIDFSQQKKIATKKVKMTPSTLQKTSLKPKTSESVAPENTGSPIDVVLSQFLVWLKAWEKKQFDSYFSFYSRSFESEGKPFNDWQQIQRESLDQIHQLKIEIDDLEMLEKEDTVEISFIERYQSDIFSDIRRKTLVWKKEEGRWRIIAESSEPA
jgi:ketosteroid isomerase-like protein